tara:strand:- start:483 stop:605 length:123 start_codon:yes stop_codon:yes gene_type:complete
MKFGTVRAGKRGKDFYIQQTVRVATDFIRRRVTAQEQKNG